MDTVNYEKKSPTAWITINRPQVMNACDPPTTDYIYECEQDFDKDPELKVLVLTGAGERAFCTGMDLKAAAARIAAGGPVSNVVPPYMKTDKVTIAAVNGYAVAGGLERALACDIRIASENAQFGCFEIRRGLPNPPDPLIRLVGFGPALHMLLSGDLIDAQEALRIGLVTKVVSAQELIPTVEELAARMGEYPTKVLVATKEAAFAGRDMTTEQSHLYARALSAPLRDSDISREGVTAFAERRKANYGESKS
jgi:enoyl-CoA hydratase/carnithine racemase